MTRDGEGPPPTSPRATTGTRRARAPIKVPILAILLVVAACAIAFTALQTASQAWHEATYTFIVFVLLIAVLASRFRRGRERIGAAGGAAMRPARLQFAVKRLMVAVAVLAPILCPLADLERRRARFRRIAAFYAERVAGYRIATGTVHVTAFDEDGRILAPRQAIKVFLNRLQKDRYDRAALRPWEPVESDDLDLVEGGWIDLPP